MARNNSGRMALRSPTVRDDVKRLQVLLAKGLAAHQAGDLHKASKLYKEILSVAPHQPDALHHLGLIQSELDVPEAAIDLLGAALRRAPRNATILSNLGKVFLRAHRYDEAIETLEQAVALRPEWPEALKQLTQAFRLAGQVEDAKYYADRLECVDGGSMFSKIEYARLCADLGDTDEARLVLSQLVTTYPDYGPAWLALARTKKWGAGDPFIDDLKAAFDRQPHTGASGKAFGYALSKVYDDLGEYDRAFEVLLIAKSCEKQVYDHRKTLAHFQALKRTFSADFFDERQSWGSSSNRPVFIVGMPRSGTSLTEQMIASHDDAFGAGELEYLSRARLELGQMLPDGQEYPLGLRQTNKYAVYALASRYLRRLKALNSSAARITDKMPHNFLALGLAQLMFPNASFVHCFRDPLDTCLSCFQQDFTAQHAYNVDLGDLGKYFVAYRDLMAHLTEVAPKNILELRYESLVASPETTARALIKHVELDWKPSILDFHNTRRRVATPSNWQVRQPLYSNSVGRWRNYEKHLGPLFEQFASLE